MLTFFSFVFVFGLGVGFGYLHGRRIQRNAVNGRLQFDSKLRGKRS